MADPTPDPTPTEQPAPDKPKPLDAKTKAQLQLAGDLPDGEKPMTKAQLEKALDRKLARHELRWVRR